MPQQTIVTTYKGETFQLPFNLGRQPTISEISSAAQAAWAKKHLSDPTVMPPLAGGTAAFLGASAAGIANRPYGEVAREMRKAPPIGTDTPGTANAIYTASKKLDALVPGWKQSSKAGDIYRALYGQYQARIPMDDSFIAGIAKSIATGDPHALLAPVAARRIQKPLASDPSSPDFWSDKAIAWRDNPDPTESYKLPFTFDELKKKIAYPSHIMHYRSGSVADIKDVAKMVKQQTGMPLAQFVWKFDTDPNKHAVPPGSAEMGLINAAQDSVKAGLSAGMGAVNPGTPGWINDMYAHLLTTPVSEGSVLFNGQTNALDKVGAAVNLGTSFLGSEKLAGAIPGVAKGALEDAARAIASRAEGPIAPGYEFRPVERPPVPVDAPVTPVPPTPEPARVPPADKLTSNLADALPGMDDKTFQLVKSAIDARIAKESAAGGTVTNKTLADMQAVQEEITRRKAPTASAEAPVPPDAATNTPPKVEAPQTGTETVKPVDLFSEGPLPETTDTSTPSGISSLKEQLQKALDEAIANDPKMRGGTRGGATSIPHEVYKAILHGSIKALDMAENLGGVARVKYTGWKKAMLDEFPGEFSEGTLAKAWDHLQEKLGLGKYSANDIPVSVQVDKIVSDMKGAGFGGKLVGAGKLTRTYASVANDIARSFKASVDQSGLLTQGGKVIFQPKLWGPWLEATLKGGAATWSDDMALKVMKDIEYGNRDQFLAFRDAGVQLGDTAKPLMQHEDVFNNSAVDWLHGAKAGNVPIGKIAMAPIIGSDRGLSAFSTSLRYRTMEMICDWHGGYQNMTSAQLKEAANLVNNLTGRATGNAKPIADALNKVLFSGHFTASGPQAYLQRPLEAIIGEHGAGILNAKTRRLAVGTTANPLMFLGASDIALRMSGQGYVDLNPTSSSFMNMVVFDPNNPDNSKEIPLAPALALLLKTGRVTADKAKGLLGMNNDSYLTSLTSQRSHSIGPADVGGKQIMAVKDIDVEKLQAEPAYKQYVTEHRLYLKAQGDPNWETWAPLNGNRLTERLPIGKYGPGEGPGDRGLYVPLKDPKADSPYANSSFITYMAQQLILNKMAPVQGWAVNRMTNAFPSSPGVLGAARDMLAPITPDTIAREATLRNDVMDKMEELVKSLPPEKQALVKDELSKLKPSDIASGVTVWDHIFSAVSAVGGLNPKTNQLQDYVNLMNSIEENKGKAPREILIRGQFPDSIKKILEANNSAAAKLKAGRSNKKKQEARLKNTGG